MKKSARFDYAQYKQKGFVASPPMIIGGIIVLVIVVLLFAGGSFKFSVGRTPSQQNQTATSETTVEESSIPTPPSVSTSTFKTFTSESMNISFEYPEDWIINEGTDSVTIALLEEGKTNNAAAGITALSKSLGSAKDLQFASIVDMQKIAIKKEFNTSELTVDEEAKIGDKEARLLGFDGNISGNPLTGRYLTTIDQDNMYAITVLADADKWSKYAGDLQKVLDSFKLLK